jgi:hypothetical protein
MGAFKGNQSRGQMGYGAQGMDDEPLNRVDNPQSLGRIYKSKYSATYGVGAYTGNRDAMDGDPIVAADTDTGNVGRSALIRAGSDKNNRLAQALPNPRRRGRMTVANKGDR